MSRRSIEIYVIRFVEVSNLAAIAFAAWQLQYGAWRDAPRNSSEVPILLLSAVPFLVALILLPTAPTPAQCLFVRAIHQAFAIVSTTVALVLLVGLPDTASSARYVALVAALQFVALYVLRKLVGDFQPARHRSIRILRVAMVVLFTLGFLMLK